MNHYDLCEQAAAHPLRYAVPTKQLTFMLWLEFEWRQSTPDDDLETDGFNMKIDCSDGRSYALNVWTFNLLEFVRRQEAETGDGLAGSYLLPPDLFVSRLEREHVAAVVAELFARNTMRPEWLIPVDTAGSGLVD